MADNLRKGVCTQMQQKAMFFAITWHFLLNLKVE